MLSDAEVVLLVVAGSALVGVMVLSFAVCLLKDELRRIRGRVADLERGFSRGKYQWE